MLSWEVNVFNVNHFSDRHSAIRRHYVPGGSTELIHALSGEDVMKRFYKAWSQPWQSTFSAFLKGARENDYSRATMVSELNKVSKSIDEHIDLVDSLTNDWNFLVTFLAAVRSGFLFSKGLNFTSEFGVQLETRNLFTFHIDTYMLKANPTSPTFRLRLGTGNMCVDLYNYLMNDIEGGRSLSNNAAYKRRYFERMVEEPELNKAKVEVLLKDLEEEPAPIQAEDLPDLELNNFENATDFKAAVKEKVQERYDAMNANQKGSDEGLRLTEVLDDDSKFNEALRQAIEDKQNHVVKASRAQQDKSLDQFLNQFAGPKQKQFGKSSDQNMGNIGVVDRLHYSAAAESKDRGQRIATSVLLDYNSSSLVEGDGRSYESAAKDLKENSFKVGAESTYHKTVDDVKDNTQYGYLLSYISFNASDEWCFNSPLCIDLGLVLPLTQPRSQATGLNSKESEFLTYLVLDFDFANLAFHGLAWNKPYLNVNLSLLFTQEDMLLDANLRPAKNWVETVKRFLTKWTKWAKDLSLDSYEALQLV